MDALAPVLAAVSPSGLSPALGPTDQAHLLWARETQAMSFAFHIPIVCFGVAFPLIVVFVEWLYVRTGDEAYKALAKRWSKVMAMIFAVGVVTGTILSFELGLLWPNFMATFGGVFGLAFGLEGFSFFLEAIFIAIYVYGWDRIPPRAHLLAGIPVVLAGFLGSLMVIAVNGWMNHPVGFDIVNGHVTHVRPWVALFNPNFWHELIHMYVAAFMVAGFLVAGVYARAWMKGDRSRYVRAGLVVPLTVAALAAPAQVVIGDWAGRTVANYQPTKLAAFEGVGKTEKGVAFHVGGYYSNGGVKAGIPIPYLLSILAKHNPNARIQGLDAVPARDRPPVNVVRFAFQGMVGIGTLLALFGIAYVVWWWRRGRVPEARWFAPAVIVSGPLALIALLCGWVTTEVGRQPWIVYEVMRTSQAVTNAGGLPVAFFFLLVTYLTLLAAVIWLLRRLAHRAPEVELQTPGRLQAT
jgi:cytochrome d ubiquinol oxidase subunit I